jgi:uncharacterized protein (TIGR03086 family)
MSTIADRYRRLASDLERKIDAVPEDRWSSPTPCEGWDARALVQHVVETHGTFLGFVGRSVGDIPSVDDDPLGAFRGARDAVQSTLDDPDAATTTFQGLTGTMSFEDGIDRFISFDLALHGWDLARATGLDDRIDPDEIECLWQHALRDAEEFGDAMRGPKVFGPEIEPPPGADRQTQLLAFLGRTT